MHERVVAVLCVVGTLAALPAHTQAYPPPLEVELSLDLDPVVQEPGFAASGRMDVQDATQHLLGEARWILSGMIYGFHFDYTPADGSRRVEESFRLEPLAQIPWGDSALSVGSTLLDDRRLTVLFRYRLSEEQETRRQAWASATVEKAGGTGTANVFLGYAQRTVALENALKESVRAYLRPRLLNRPREARGLLVLWEVAQTRIWAGEYHTRVVTHLKMDDIIPYRVY